MEVAAAAAAAAAAAGDSDSDSQETGQDAAAGEEGDDVERSAEPAGRSHRARRATEKGLALQSRVMRSRTPRKAAGGEVRTAFSLFTADNTGFASTSCQLLHLSH
jgi:hypothetical protein